jgi:hypothetical protein
MASAATSGTSLEVTTAGSIAFGWDRGADPEEFMKFTSGTLASGTAPGRRKSTIMRVSSFTAAQQEPVMKHWIVASLATLVLAVPGVVAAHEGHLHKVMGTVTDIDYPHIELTTTDKKSVTIMLDPATVVTRGKAKVKDTDIKIGDRIAADYEEKGGMLMVHALKIGVATPAPAAAPKK